MGTIIRRKFQSLKGFDERFLLVGNRGRTLSKLDSRAIQLGCAVDPPVLFVFEATDFQLEEDQ